MTQELGDMFTALQNNQVSALFEKAGYTSLRPLTSWFADLSLRVEFFCDWVERGAPVAYWISAYYSPYGFLAAALHGYSRQHETPADISVSNSRRRIATTLPSCFRKFKLSGRRTSRKIARNIQRVMTHPAQAR